MLISTAEIRKQFSDVINRIAYAKERVVLTRRGKPFMAMVPLEDLKLLQAMEDAVDLAEIQKARLETREKGNISLTELERELNARWQATKLKSFPPPGDKS